jgi:hypothetical protein
VESNLVEVNKAINGVMFKTTTGEEIVKGYNMVLTLVEDHSDLKM